MFFGCKHGELCGYKFVAERAWLKTRVGGYILCVVGEEHQQRLKTREEEMIYFLLVGQKPTAVYAVGTNYGKHRDWVQVKKTCGKWGRVGDGGYFV